MEKLGLNELRERYLSFFESKGHLRLPSFSLVPQNDPSLLLINAGMAPLKPYFTGQSVPPRKRVTTCQKCIRTLDIENVGKTARHGTFFEMLGNFSFGDYFKTEAISWSWEFLTKDLEIPAELLYVSIYEEDDEAYDIWHNTIGLSDDHIVRLGKEDNFWELTSGPCGPCSEIYFDRGPEKGCGRPDCGVGCECDRFIEVWNNVFTQFNRDEAGNYTRLAHPNIDTGMGLERLACVMQGVDSLFDTDTVGRILNTVCKISGKTYPSGTKSDVSIRVITDHCRGVAMMAADGILPSNEGRGYIMRRLLRRAARHGKLIGIDKAFLCEVVDAAIAESGKAYPELIEKRNYILQVVSNEEERFYKTIDLGLVMLQEFIDSAKSEGRTVLSGDAVFKLHDTYGFPLDLTLEIAQENGLDVDRDGFKEKMEEQRKRGRENLKAAQASGWASGALAVCVGDPATVFEGYGALETESEIRRIFTENELVEVAAEGEEVMVMLDRTPFYAEMGGQEGDSGTITAADGSFELEIDDCRKAGDGKFIHYGRVTRGNAATGAKVLAKVNKAMRWDIEKNHTATHLLHKALRMVLGDHVAQAGSQVGPDSFRFDFSHFKAMTQEEIDRAEDIVNEKILEGIEVYTDIKSQQEAKAEGATALFGEKYGDTVRVVNVGDFSKELCGGTHVDTTSRIGIFKIVSEGAVAAGIRRIEGITGRAAIEYAKRQDAAIKAAAAALKAAPADMIKKIDSMNAELKELQKSGAALKSQLLKYEADSFIEKNSTAISEGINLVAGKLDAMSADDLRAFAEILRDKTDGGVAVLASENDGKAVVVAACGKQAVASGVNCGAVVKAFAAVCGGGGGGKPDIAQAGGRDASKIDEALAAVEGNIRGMLK